MSLAEVREEVVKKRRLVRKLPNSLGPVKNIWEFRKLMEWNHLDYPVIVRFDPDDLASQRVVRKSVEIFSLLSEAAQNNCGEVKGKVLFVYRNLEPIKRC